MVNRLNVDESIICAGFGGQGIMLLGKVLATTGMQAGLQVTWVPSYGAEVRGGTAHSDIRISSKPIADPLVFMASSAIIMNEPSLDKFESKIQPGGLVILNTSMIKRKIKRNDIDVLEAPLTDEAIKLGNVRVANMIAAGIYVEKKKILSPEALIQAIQKMAETAGTASRIPINIKAVEKGIQIAKSHRK
jgi:2-oxoglutarate ferredoxin oxidoreductase subunit gamma